MAKSKPSRKDKSSKSKKKESQFVLRIDADLRDEFVEICKELDTSAAREIRRFMKKFIKKHESLG